MFTEVYMKFVRETNWPGIYCYVGIHELYRLMLRYVCIVMRGAQ